MSSARPGPSAVRPGEHACSRFASAEDRDRLTSAFIADGLARRHKVVYIRDRGPRGGRRADGLGEAFDAAEDGQLAVFDAHEVYLSDAAFDVEGTVEWALAQQSLARAEGWEGMSVAGDRSALHGAPGVERIVEYEGRLDEVLDTGTTSMLCQYDLRRFPPTAPHQVAELHRVDIAPELAALGRTGSLAAALIGPAGTLRLAGDLDLHSATAVDDLLHAHFHGPLRLDLADLHHVDVVGLRALRGRDAQRLDIVGASPTARRLLKLLAWDTDSDIDIAGTPPPSAATGRERPPTA
jgi:anti-anti-sigma regulatory factor